jgi:hypothetical protein
MTAVVIELTIDVKRRIFAISPELDEKMNVIFNWSENVVRCT